MSDFDDGLEIKSFFMNKRRKSFKLFLWLNLIYKQKLKPCSVGYSE